MKALILGCGRIGAFEDWDSTDEIKTYAKGLNEVNIDTDFFDISEKAAKQCCRRYGGQYFTCIEDITIKDYEMCIVSTPSMHHEKYLLYLMQQNIKTIICEKPIALTLESLQKLETAYEQSSSNVFVNYRRRYSSKAFEIRKTIRETLDNDEITDIIITYQKGVLNNCSHAFDFLNYLLETNIKFENVNITRIAYDEFENDPTISFNLKFGRIHINAIGLVSAKHSYLNISIYFNNGMINFSECGEKVTIYKSKKANSKLITNSYHPKANKIIERDMLLKHCMTNIIQTALNSNKKSEISDNFKESLLLGRGMIKSLLNN